MLSCCCEVAGVFVVSLTYTYLGLNDFLHLVYSNFRILPHEEGNERLYQSIHEISSACRCEVRHEHGSFTALWCHNHVMTGYATNRNRLLARSGMCTAVEAQPCCMVATNWFLITQQCHADCGKLDSRQQLQNLKGQM